MSRVHIIHRDNRPWRPPHNHLDGRVCPDCGATCHGSKAQAKHKDWHQRNWDRMTEFAKRTGMTEEEFENRPWSWGAEITGTEGEIEAAEG